MKDNTVRKEITTLIKFPQLEELTNRQIDNRVKKCLELKAQEKALANKRMAIEKELKEFLGKREEFNTEKSHIIYPRYVERRFNTTAFAKEYNDLYEAFREPKQRSKFDYDMA